MLVCIWMWYYFVVYGYCFMFKFYLDFFSRLSMHLSLLVYVSPKIYVQLELDRFIWKTEINTSFSIMFIINVHFKLWCREVFWYQDAFLLCLHMILEIQSSSKVDRFHLKIKFSMLLIFFCWKLNWIHSLFVFRNYCQK